jgi:hypothetical protein
LRFQRLIEALHAAGRPQAAQQYEVRLREMLAQHPAKPQQR